MWLDVSSSNINCGGEFSNMGCFHGEATVAQAMACQAMVAQALTLR